MGSRTLTLFGSITLLSLTGGAGGAWADNPPAYVSPSQARITQDVTYLAADAQEGRGPGTRGIESAADYIAGVFREAGLKPAPGAQGYFQPFTLKGNPTIEGTPTLVIEKAEGGKIEAPRDSFSPLAVGSSANLSGVPIVFAGYGITAKDEKLKLDYDDYAGQDVQGKVVLLLRREPQLDNENSPFLGKTTSVYASVNHKVTNAFQHGAAGVLFVNDRAGLQGNADRLVPLGGFGEEQNSAIPFVMIQRELANQILAAAGAPTLETFETEIDADLKPRTRVLEKVTLTENVAIERKGITTKNVVGVLEGAGPLANETIVVGGHYDHLGSGGLTSGSLAFFSRDIHNGADDNASGTAMVMELARRLARRPDPLPRRVVFMAFSGEEKGLLGSRYYVEHPLIPLDQTVMMINFDMVGRLSDKSELTIVGTGSTPGIEELVDALGTASGFVIKKVKGMSDGFGGSDHESFYKKDIPVLFPFTGLHPDYHRPSDDSDKINYPGMARIADLGELILLDVARRPSRPVFAKAAEAPKPAHGGGGGGGSGTADPGRLSTSAYLGTVPDYTGEEKGVKLADVRPDSPAAKGGLKGGDVIVGFAGKPISTIYDYTENLGRAKPGDKVEITVKRDGKDVTLSVTLGTRSGQ